MSEQQLMSCPSCGESVPSEQQWCLNCGVRLLKKAEIRRPGWRSAFSITSLTIFLVFAGSVAAYATLLKDAKGEGAKPAPPAANPAVAKAAPPQTPYDENQAAKKGETKMQTVKNPLNDGTNRNTPKQPLGTSAFNNGIGNLQGSGSPIASSPPSEPPPVPVTIGPNNIEVFDPQSRPGADYGDEEATNNIIDNDPESFWNVSVPVDGDNVNVGLLIDPRAPQEFVELELKTWTPGFSMVIYATNSEDPSNDLTNDSWKILTKKKNVQDGEKIDLQKRIRDKKFRYLLLWFTKVSKERRERDPVVAVSELKLLAKQSASTTATNNQNQQQGQETGADTQGNDTTGQK